MSNIKLFDGSEFRVLAVFDDGYSFIVEDDGCYCIVNGYDENAHLTTHVSAEALSVLKDLPSNPYHTRLGYDASKEESLDEN